MKSILFENDEKWHEFRVGKITGTRSKSIGKRGKRLIGYYEMIAERMGIPADTEDVMERGNRLEPVAIAAFEALTGKKFLRGKYVWIADQNDRLTCSPDAFAEDLTEAVEVKCLSSARHLMAIDTQEFPAEYKPQALKYFVCNEKLHTLYFLMYDDRIVGKPLVVFELLRSRYQTEIDEMLAQEMLAVLESDQFIQKISNF